jgi:hypothetical protein
LYTIRSKESNFLPAETTIYLTSLNQISKAFFMVNMHFRALKTFDLVVLFILKQTNWTLSHLSSVHFVLFQVRMISIFACCLRTSTSAYYTPEYPPERSLAIFYLFSLPLLSFSFSPTLFFNCSQLCS